MIKKILIVSLVVLPLTASAVWYNPLTWFSSNEISLGAAGDKTFVPTLLPKSDSLWDIGTSTNAFREIWGDTFCLTGDSCISTWGGGSGEVNTGASLGTGLNIFDSKSGTSLRFNSLLAGTNITLSTTTDDNTIVISSTASGGGSGTVSTSTNETAGNLAYWTSNSGTPALLGEVATGTVSGTNNISVTASRYVLNGDLAISGAALVPYTGATGDVNLGANNLSGSNMITTGGGFLIYSNGGIGFYSDPGFTLSGSVSAPSLGSIAFTANGGGNLGTLNFSSLTNDRTFTFPDATGTLCLTTTCTGISSYDAWTHPSAGISATSTKIFGIGTTTPVLNGLTVASSTILSDGAGVASWVTRNAGGNLYFATTTVAGTATTSTSALTIIGSNGNVGIGTTTPAYTLDVNGTINSSGIITQNGIGLVPYTGATTDVDLGLFNLSTPLIKYLGVGVFDVASYSLSNASGQKIDWSLAGQVKLLDEQAGVGALLDMTSLTSDQTFTFPDLTGTFALLENSQTFTGTKTFSNDTYSALFTGGNVGIGTTSPYATLSVVGDGVFTRNLNTANFTATGTATFSGLSQGFAYIGSGGIFQTVSTSTALSSKQDVLVSGTNIKTINGSSILGSGDLTVVGGSSAYEIATTSDIAVPNVAYFTQTGGRTTLGSVATGTLAVPTGLTVTANRYVLGGSATIGLDTGYVIPLQSTLDGKESVLTFNYPLSRSANAISFNGLGTTTTWTAGQVPYIVNGNTLTGLSTTTVTASSPLSLSNPVVKLGGSNSVLSLDTSGAWSGSAGSVANALTAGTGLTSAGTYNGSVARTFSLNLGNANTWTALQTFAHSSTTGQASFANASSTLWYGGGLQTCDPTTGKLTWANGQFGCGTDFNTGGGGGADFTYATDIGYGVTGSATSTKISFTQGIHASSTSHFAQASTTQLTVTGTGTSTVLMGNVRIGGNLLVDGNLEVSGGLWPLIIALIAAAMSAYTITFTNKRIQPRSSTTTSTATLTPALGTANVWQLTAQAEALTIAAPTGTPVLGEVIHILLKATGSARAITWNGTYKAIGEALKTSISTTKRMEVVAVYDGTDWITSTTEEV